MHIAPSTTTIDLHPLMELSVGSTIGQLRAVPVSLGPNEPRAFLATYGADFDVDPYVEMFFYPTDTLKMILFTGSGEIIWRRDLGRGVVPGVWFCPVFAFDLDGDGVEEIYYVDNPNVDHPLGLASYRLTALDARSGEPCGHWPWPNRAGNSQSLSHTFRNFLLGGQVDGQPVLVTGQGTYGPMFLQAWNAGMVLRWEHEIPDQVPGARGSHMCPVVDLDGDGKDEILWGERVIELDTGTERFCADGDVYAGHSDIVQPVLERGTGDWFIYTCRESDAQTAPRVATFDALGNRLWGDLDQGHIDMGWVARMGEGGRHLASAIRIGAKTCGPDGRFHQDMEEFCYEALTGQSVELPFSVYRTLPVDVDGDGLHELVRGRASGNGEVIDRAGRVVGNLGGAVALASKLLDRPGEQLLSYSGDGTLRIWADLNAEDSVAAESRYRHPAYQALERLFSTGYNLTVLGGI